MSISEDTNEKRPRVILEEAPVVSKPRPSKLSRRRSSRLSEESYNPFKHRHVLKPTTDCGALAHLLKTSLGSGILAMPMAIKNAGLVLGVIGTILIGLICTHCLQLLIRSSQELCKRARVPELGYAETAEAAFTLGPDKVKKWAKPMNWVVNRVVKSRSLAVRENFQVNQPLSRRLPSANLFKRVPDYPSGLVPLENLPYGTTVNWRIIITMQLLLSFVLGNTVYVVFISESMKQVTDFYFRLEINIRYYMLMLWIPLILMCLFRSLKSLVPFSVLANIFVIISFSITLYYIFREIHKPEKENLVSPWYKWPFFLTTVVFSLEGIGTVMSIENEMKNPQNLLNSHKKCCGILYISMTVVVALYSVIGFFGYLQYGEDTQGSITLNLPITEALAQAVKILIALAIFFTYALQFYVPINITKTLVLNAVKKNDNVQEKYFIFIDIAVRASLVSLTVIVAMAIPKLEPVITLVGAVCFSMLGLTFPPMLDTVVREPNFGRFKWRLVKNILIIVFSMTVLVSGTYAGVISIIDVYIKGE